MYFDSPIPITWLCASTQSKIWTTFVW